MLIPNCAGGGAGEVGGRATLEEERGRDRGRGERGIGDMFTQFK